MPNVRDHDASVYLRLQGDALSVGGYETNPIFWEEVRHQGSRRGVGLRFRAETPFSRDPCPGVLPQPGKWQVPDPMGSNPYFSSP